MQFLPPKLICRNLLGEVSESDKGNYGASAHSDYGMITLLVTDGVPGLQVCLLSGIKWKHVFFMFYNFHSPPKKSALAILLDVMIFYYVASVPFWYRVHHLCISYWLWCFWCNILLYICNLFSILMHQIFFYLNIFSGNMQICREKDRNPQLWEDVHHIEG